MDQIANDVVKTRNFAQVHQFGVSLDLWHSTVSFTVTCNFPLLFCCVVEHLWENCDFFSHGRVCNYEWRHLWWCIFFKLFIISIIAGYQWWRNISFGSCMFTIQCSIDCNIDNGRINPIGYLCWIYTTSHQIITSIFNHFKINEKVDKIETEWYKFKETLEKENDTTDTKIKMSLVLNTSSSNDVDAILGADIESGNDNCCMIDMIDHASDCEEHTWFQDAINELKLRELGYLHKLFYRLGIDASVNAIQEKIQQVVEHQQLPNINEIKCNPWNDQIQFQVDISLDRYIKRAQLTDYQRELMQKWLKFVTFAKILGSILMIRMMLRVVLIFWLFHNVIFTI